MNGKQQQAEQLFNAIEVEWVANGSELIAVQVHTFARLMLESSVCSPWLQECAEGFNQLADDLDALAGELRGAPAPSERGDHLRLVRGR